MSRKGAHQISSQNLTNLWPTHFFKSTSVHREKLHKNEVFR